MTTETTRIHLTTVLTDLAQLLEGVDDAHGAHPTPCEQFDVRALTGHVVGWLENFAAGYADADGACPASDVSDVQVEQAQAPARVRAAAAQLDAALQDGAAQRPLTIAGQGMPGEMALSLILSEYVVHGWDLARSTGQDWAPPEEAVTASLTFLQGMVTDEYRGPDGMFSAEVDVPDDAPALDRLVGFAGRNPHWSPA